MDARIISKPVVFEEVIIELKLKNEDDVRDLWHRLNITRKEVRMAYSKKQRDLYVYDEEGYTNTDKLWDILNGLMNSRDIKP